MEASLVAKTIRQRLKEDHKDCEVDGCGLKLLWAEDIQEILNHAEELKIK